MTRDITLSSSSARCRFSLVLTSLRPAVDQHFRSSESPPQTHSLHRTNLHAIRPISKLLVKWKYPRRVEPSGTKVCRDEGLVCSLLSCTHRGWCPLSQAVAVRPADTGEQNRSPRLPAQEGAHPAAGSNLAPNLKFGTLPEPHCSRLRQNTVGSPNREQACRPGIEAQITGKWSPYLGLFVIQSALTMVWSAPLWKSRVESYGISYTTILSAMPRSAASF